MTSLTVKLLGSFFINKTNKHRRPAAIPYARIHISQKMSAGYSKRIQD